MGISRLALWSEVMQISVVEPMIVSGYEREALREWRDGGGDSPHGAKWFTSFHASSFPGDDPLACGRKALYELMGLPDSEPRAPRLSAMFDLGKNLELDWIRRLAAEGVLLSADQTAGDVFQTGFVDPEHWLTGNPDALILPPFWRKSHALEIKTTSHEKVLAMRANPSDTPFSHAKYLRQLKTYIALAREAPFAPDVTVCKDSWAIMSNPVGDLRWCPIHQSFECSVEYVSLDVPDDGTLIYSSREEPLTTMSYLVAHDEDHMRLGRERLAQWRESFLVGEIPEHPHEGQRAKWSVDPCRYCGLKRSCKADYTARITTLADSHQIESARIVRPDYSYEASRRAVLERWGVEDRVAQRYTA